jgi:hypothetical protein
MPKSEIPNPNIETISNRENVNFQTKAVREREFPALNFRSGCFGFRASDFGFGL